MGNHRLVSKTTGQGRICERTVLKVKLDTLGQDYWYSSRVLR